jgi:hypothetical protein
MRLTHGYWNPQLAIHLDRLQPIEHSAGISVPFIFMESRFYLGEYGLFDHWFVRTYRQTRIGSSQLTKEIYEPHTDRPVDFLLLPRSELLTTATGSAALERVDNSRLSSAADRLTAIIRR